MDILTPEQRSKNMAAIRSRDTKPEIYIRKLLFSQGYRYRLNYKQIPGHPDLYLKKYNTTVFIHGCYWHRHENCKYAYTPKSNIEFWKNKFNSNLRRDSAVQEELKKRGIKCLIIWECTVKQMKKNSDICKLYLNTIELFLKSNELYKSL